MFVSKLNFSEVLERFYNNQIIDGFYHQDRYDFLLLFVSSFDGNDINIISLKLLRMPNGLTELQVTESVSSTLLTEIITKTN